MRLVPFLVLLLLVPAAAAAPEGRQEVVVLAPGVDALYRFEVPEDGPVSFGLMLRSGALYDASVSAVGECGGVTLAGGGWIVVGAVLTRPMTQDCGVLEAGTYTVRVSATAGTGVISLYLEGATWA